MPYELLEAIDLWTWRRVRSAKRVRITDPEGTDVEFTNHDGYYDRNREFLNADLVHDTWTGNEGFGRTYLPGHVLGKPWVYLPGKEDGSGIIAGTTNHIAPVDWTQLVLDGSRIVEINAGGEFGARLRKLKSETDHLSYPGFPGKGLFYWWEASIGTNPHIHRPRSGFPSGWVNCLYERVRSGVIHIGFGTIISSMNERRAAKAGLPVGHWHLHLYFPTVRLEREGDDEPSSRTAACSRSTIPTSAGSPTGTAAPTSGCRRAGSRRCPASMSPATIGSITPRSARLGEDRIADLPRMASPVHADGRRRSALLP